ncbi:hypothetical protein MHZ92_07315 [Sporosarcina sp. ACRSL]|uniref:hypothetical protein n=1 Tax=Sporosarcina sp. ACRSL TaxID=2918215 RepID=UPI001EF61801|nr:hypothetical protein [Sporosarcina sp. ACRSL]MCG7343936.1 hypothetical protein [Sporosarcina sp. ACRSL]
MEELVLHIPWLYTIRHVLHKKSETWGKMFEEEVIGFSLPETFVTADHEVIIADYEFDELTVLKVGDVQFIQNLKENGIEFEPREMSFLLKRPSQKKNHHFKRH